MSDPQVDPTEPDGTEHEGEQVNDVVADNEAEEETVELLEPGDPPV